MEKRWARPVIARQQSCLFSSLDELLPERHPVRVLEALLSRLDWSEWESHYTPGQGQPPVHPRLMAGCIVYGLLRRIRSSRDLEEATRERLDFQWFLEGRTVDHSTFASFRTRFEQTLRGLNQTLAREICGAHDNALVNLMIDGTRVRADSDRHAVRTAPALERLIAQCAQQLNERLERLKRMDEGPERDEGCIAELQAEMERLRAQIASYEAAAQVAHARDEGRRKKDGKKAQPVAVPVSDPDAVVLPNKEGGFAPNYTPTVAIDAASGAIIDAAVPAGAHENAAVLPAVEAARALGGEPLRVIGDGSFADGETLEKLKEEQIEAYVPIAGAPEANSVAHRPDPAQPVPASQWEALPTARKQIAPSAFCYDAENDCYWCPMGQPLKPYRRGKQYRSGVPHVQYVCPGKAHCPLAERCVRKKARARTIIRDPYQPLREETARRMATDEARALYKTRAPKVEGVFATIKSLLGVRKFLLRGLPKVRIEWNWVCCAYNFKILLRRRPEQTLGPSKGHFLLIRFNTQHTNYPSLHRLACTA
jgi:transposase